MDKESIVERLFEQLAAKDRQLAAKDRQLADKEGQLRAKNDQLVQELQKHAGQLKEKEDKHAALVREKEEKHAGQLKEKEDKHAALVREKEEKHAGQLKEKEEMLRKKGEELLELAVQNRALKKDLDSAVRRNAEWERSAARSAMRGGWTPHESASSYSEAYKRLTEDEKKTQGVEALVGTRLEDMAAPLEGFCRYEDLKAAQDGKEATMQEVMNKQLAWAAEGMGDRVYSDTHARRDLVAGRSPDGAFFVDRNGLFEGALLLVELKKWREGRFTDTHLGQAMTYGVAVLSKCPGRRHVFVVLLSGSALQLVKVEAGSPRKKSFGPVLAFTAADGEVSDGVRLLWHLARASWRTLGYGLVSLPPGLFPKASCRALAVGGYSSVFLGDYPGYFEGTAEFVLKVYERPFEDDDDPERRRKGARRAYAKEKAVLERFERLRADGSAEWSDHVRHVPRLLRRLPASTGRDVPAPFPASDDPAMVPSASSEGAAAAPADFKLPYLVMAFAGQPHVQWNVTHFHGLVLALEVAHKQLKLVHRDLRPPNISHNGAVACLLDWGMSTSLEGDDELDCTCHGFSPIRCPCVERRPYEPKDDLCSLVLLYVYLVERRKGGNGPDWRKIPLAVLASSRARYWSGSGFAHDLYQMALREDYNGLKRLLEQNDSLHD